MKFEVIGPDKKCKMSTTSEECIYPEDILLDMMEAGYTFLKNGKDWKPTKKRGKRSKT